MFDSTTILTKTPHQRHVPHPREFGRLVKTKMKTKTKTKNRKYEYGAQSRGTQWTVLYCSQGSGVTSDLEIHEETWDDVTDHEEEYPEQCDRYKVHTQTHTDVRHNHMWCPRVTPSYKRFSASGVWVTPSPSFILSLSQKCSLVIQFAKSNMLLICPLLYFVLVDVSWPSNGTVVLGCSSLKSEVRGGIVWLPPLPLTRQQNYCKLQRLCLQLYKSWRFNMTFKCHAMKTVCQQRHNKRITVFSFLFVWHC